MSLPYCHETLKVLCNSLELELHETSHAQFRCHGENSALFNRIFVVRKDNGPERSSIIRTKDGKYVEMRPRHLYFISCCTQIKFQFQEGMEFFAFHFSVHLKNSYDIFLQTMLLEEIPCKMELTDCLEEIFAHEKPTLQDLFTLRSFIHSEVAKFCPGNSADQLVTRFPQYLELIDFMHKKATAQTTVDELAKITGMGRDTLSRNFSRTFGIPLKRYLSGVVATRAAELLKSSSTKLRTVAAELGFNDEYYFSRFFKKETGYAPGAYRRQLFNRKVILPHGST